MNFQSCHRHLQNGSVIPIPSFYNPLIIACGFNLSCVVNKHISTCVPVSITRNTEPLHQLGATAFTARHTDATTVHTHIHMS